MVNEKIEVDFVLLWVDGNDIEWQKEILKYVDNIDFQRYREWDTLKYIFRGFEKFTPWVRKIHFVTCGHIPDWLDTTHPKLNIVNHKDILKTENIPVFNSEAIEINIHRIKGLSEYFVYFNDDTFIVKAMKQKLFFRNKLPCDSFIFNAISPAENSVYTSISKGIEVINKHFNKKEIITKNFFKIFNYKYGKENYKNIVLSLWPKVTGFNDPHMPTAFLKRTFYEVWNEEKKLLSEVSSKKIRSLGCINQYLFRYWQLSKGDFFPKKINKQKYFNITTIKELEKVKKKIIEKKFEMICLNDNFHGDASEFEKIKHEIKGLFDSIGLEKKSNFEMK